MGKTKEPDILDDKIMNVLGIPRNRKLRKAILADAEAREQMIKAMQRRRKEYLERKVGAALDRVVAASKVLDTTEVAPGTPTWRHLVNELKGEGE